MSYEIQMQELERLFAAWGKLPDRVRAAILVLAGVRESPGPGPRRKLRRPKPGESPAWLLVALNILKDSHGSISDRKMAARLGVSHTTLSRNQTYQQARKAYFQPARRMARVPGKSGLRE